MTDIANIKKGTKLVPFANPTAGPATVLGFTRKPDGVKRVRVQHATGRKTVALPASVRSNYAVVS